MQEFTSQLPQDQPQHVTVVYVCDEAQQDDGLGKRLAEVVERYSPLVTLVVTNQADLPTGFASAGAQAPTLFVLRGTEVVGHAAGARLPVRELDRVVRCAVEWPA